MCIYFTSVKLGNATVEATFQLPIFTIVSRKDYSKEDGVERDVEKPVA